WYVWFGRQRDTTNLTISKTGNGKVTSSPRDINCGSICSESFTPGSQVTLTATPASGAQFTGWGGVCSGTATTCIVNISGSQSVTATFSPITYALSLTVYGNPGGKVTSLPAGIDCGSSCSHAFNAGTQVTLTATPDTAWGFFGWSGGGCSGLAPSCTVTVNGSTSVSASFRALFGVEVMSGEAILPAPVIVPYPQYPVAY